MSEDVDKILEIRSKSTEKDVISKEGEYYEETDIQDEHIKSTSSIAIAALVVGIFAVILAFLSFKSEFILIPFGMSIISAPTLGISALIQIGLGKGKLRGRSLAILGICASPVSIICFFFYWITHFTLPA